MNISALFGKTLADVKVTDDKTEIYFTTTSGQKFKMFHNQDCCERVLVEDVCGDLSDLIGSPILQADESRSEKKDEYDGACEWTFYRLTTMKGQVVIRWYGTSNGYYSTSVDFCKVA